VGVGAVIKNCILQDDTVVEKGAVLDCIIADRSVVISENRGMTGYRTYPIYIERYKVI
jgi:glucose-1-phosphate adenylyltransferase